MIRLVQCLKKIQAAAQFVDNQVRVTTNRL